MDLGDERSAELGSPGVEVSIGDGDDGDDGEFVCGGVAGGADGFADIGGDAARDCEFGYD